MKLIKDLQKLLEADDPSKDEETVETEETPEDESAEDVGNDDAADETPSDDTDKDNSGVTDADEVPVEDVGSVSQEQGFAKSKKEMFAFGKTRPVTLLTKDEQLGGLEITLQYVINPATGAWKLRACLAGQSEEDMVEFDSGEDPSSLIKSLKKKNKITPHQAVDRLNPPADKVVKESVDSKEYVVIGNAGAARGQTLWPSTDMPDLFTKAEADKIAKEQNDSEKKSARPGYQMHWHVQHLDDAHKYVTGRAATSIQNLKDTAFGDYDDEE